MSTPLTPEKKEQLCGAAQAVARLAYAPYSKFRVGAALLADGRVFSAANVENASYGLSLCAERAAFAKAISEGATGFRAMAIACIDAQAIGQDIREFLPCGACRQWMVEFAEDLEIIICGTDQVFGLEELLPLPFRLRKNA